MSKFSVVGKYNSLSYAKKAIAILGILFVILVSYYIGLSMLQYLLANTFNVYYTKVQLFTATVCWGIFESLSGLVNKFWE